MKISTEWTDAERLQVSNMIATEMMESFNGNDIQSVDVVGWAQRLAFVACKPAEFLEDNRKNILVERFEHRGDVSVIDSLKAEAKEMIKFEETQRQWRKELC